MQELTLFLLVIALGGIALVFKLLYRLDKKLDERANTPMPVPPVQAKKAPRTWLKLAAKFTNKALSHPLDLGYLSVEISTNSKKDLPVQLTVFLEDMVGHTTKLADQFIGGVSAVGNTCTLPAEWTSYADSAGILHCNVICQITSDTRFEDWGEGLILPLVCTFDETGLIEVKYPEPMEKKIYVKTAQ